MRDSDDHELAEQLASLRPRAVSERFAGRVAERMETDPLASRRRARRRFLAAGSVAAAVLLLVTAIILWPVQPSAPLESKSVEIQSAPAGDAPDSPSSQSTYAVLRAALAESPERLMALLDEQSLRPAGTPTAVWRYLDRDLAMEEEIP